MFNGINLLDLKYSYVEGGNYRDALDNLLKKIENQPEGTKIIQPMIIGKKFITIETQGKNIPIEFTGSIPRPFSFNEFAEIVVELGNSCKRDKYILENRIFPDYRGPVTSDHIRGSVTSNHIDTITSTAHPKMDNSQYKIVQISKKLMSLPKKFSGEAVIETDYENIDGILIKKKNEKYNKLLTDKEYNNHPFWNNVILDENVRKEFRKMLKHIIKNKLNLNELPELFFGVYCIEVDKSIAKDYERAVCFNKHKVTYGAGANSNFYSNRAFLVVNLQKNK